MVSKVMAEVLLVRKDKVTGSWFSLIIGTLYYIAESASYWKEENILVKTVLFWKKAYSYYYRIIFRK